jgi:hypothetical protein
MDAGIHAEVARVWGNEPAELAACRRLVAFHCLYGVDKNPLAVELARVSLWLATAASDHPLTFLNHRLVPGDSLLGITVDDLLRGFYRKKVKKALTGDEPAQGELPFYFNRTELDVRLQLAFRHLREIERLETEQPGDFEDQQNAWLTVQQQLAEFVEAHYLRIGRASVAVPARGSAVLSLPTPNSVAPQFRRRWRPTAPHWPSAATPRPASVELSLRTTPM